jgi:hypothetical protein
MGRFSFSVNVKLCLKKFSYINKHEQNIMIIFFVEVGDNFTNKQEIGQIDLNNFLAEETGFLSACPPMMHNG